MNSPLSGAAKVDTLFEDEACAVVNKPGGLLTQAPPGIASLEHWARQKFSPTSATPEGDSLEKSPGRSAFRIGVPHRLDRPVSGAIVLGKSKRYTAELSSQFRSRVVTKTYWAVVCGKPGEERTVWQDWMRKITGVAKSEVVKQGADGAQEALLEYEVLDSNDQVSWLRIELQTGRTHQIRLQAASRGHCILGDQQYGCPVPFGPGSRDLRARWIALHARRLCFVTPADSTRVEVVAPLPICWQSVSDCFPKMQQDDFA